MMITVNARILQSAPVLYKVNNQLKITLAPKASWNMAGKHFSNAKTLQDWTFVQFVQNDIGPADIARVLLQVPTPYALLT